MKNTTTNEVTPLRDAEIVDVRGYKLPECSIEGHIRMTTHRTEAGARKAAAKDGAIAFILRWQSEIGNYVFGNYVTDATYEARRSVPPATSQSKARAKLEALAWKHTHNDFKSKREDGTRVVLKYIDGKGTCSVELSSLTDAELLAKVPASVRAAVSS